MIINVESKFNSSFAKIVSYVKLSNTLKFIAHPLLIFEPIEPEKYPKVWRNGEYLVKLRIFGVIPFGTQSIRIELIKVNTPDEFILRDNGQGQVAKIWDHWIIIQSTPDANLTRFIDRIEIKAGWMTIPVCLFAAIFYRWRQFRWKKLIRNNFGEISLPIESKSISKKRST
ncbi:hypothetical protein LPTSP4_01440 [Leptospira ryugenii]|uniref:Uncharacterized protein n=1 Tax=Leptospira ryugenii TaxID=1917863 RepID=A0A2P2DVK1_9LEPT|nr:hypothetical protein [Leptospira ryugenii]GBF48644.1 hypothetical protein LPTSP4_01440 [Leptospira ryugenii]